MENSNISIPREYLEQLNYNVTLNYEKSADLAAILKTIFEKDIEKSTNNDKKFTTIKKHFTIITEALVKQYNEILFSSEEIKGIINSEICKYLLIWLECSSNTTQTIYSFVKQEYALSSEQKRHKSGEDTLSVEKDKLAAISRGIDVYRENINLQNTQAQRENIHYRRFPYSTDSYKKYNFVELCFAKAYAQGELYLYNTLYLQKEILKTKTHSNLNYLESGYKQYALFAKDILQPSSDKEFVVKNLLLYKLEYTNRLIFAAHIGKYMIENNINIKSSLPQKMEWYYKRYKRNKYTMGIDISPFITEYNKIIDLAYKDKISDDMITKIQVSRDIVEKSIVLFFITHSQNILFEWTNEDFKSVAQFFKRDYKIPKILVELNLENVKYKNVGGFSVYDYVKEAYMKLVDQNNMYLAHTTLKSKAQKKNKRSHNKH